MNFNKIMTFVVDVVVHEIPVWNQGRQDHDFCLVIIILFVRSKNEHRIKLNSFKEKNNSSSKNDERHSYAGLLKCHPVLDAAQTLDLDLHDVSVLQPQRLLHAHRNARRGSRQDDRTSLQCRALTDERYDGLDVEEQVVGDRVLSHVSVHERLQPEITSVAHDLRGDNHRAQRCELVESLAETPLRHASCERWVALPLSRRHVVRNHKSSNVVEGLGFGDVFSGLANDDAELAFIVELVVLRELGDRDVFVVSCHCPAGLDEDGGIRWRVPAALLDCRKWLDLLSFGSLGSQGSYCASCS